MVLRRGPSGRKLAGSENGQALAWDSSLGEWVPEALTNLMPGAPSYNITKPPFNSSGLSLAPDDTNALSLAIEAANAQPGVIWLGQRHRYTAALPTMRNNNIMILGRGAFNGGTIVQADSATPIDGFVALNCQYTALANFWITSNRVHTTGAGIKMSGCFRARADNVLITTFGIGTETDRSTLTEYRQVNVGDLFGAAGHYAHGASGVFNHAAKYRDCVGGTDYPLGLAGQAAAWAQSTAYIVGQIVLANGNIYQCSQAGTSSASGVGPSSIPSSFASSAHTTPITDGSCQWRFAMPALTWYLQGSYSHTFEVLDCGALQGALGLDVRDDAPGSGSEPQFCRTHNLQIDHPFSRGIRLAAGSAHRHSMLFVTSVMGGSGVEVTSDMDGNWEFEGGEVFGCADAGFVIGRGHGLLQGLQVGGVSGRASNTRDGCEVAAGVTDVTIANCSFGRMFSSLSPASRYGISVGAGADNYIIANNRCIGNVTAGILNTPGVAATRVLTSNIGSIV